MLDFEAKLTLLKKSMYETEYLDSHIETWERLVVFLLETIFVANYIIE